MYIYKMIIKKLKNENENEKRKRLIQKNEKLRFYSI